MCEWYGRNNIVGCINTQKRNEGRFASCANAHGDVKRPCSFLSANPSFHRQWIFILFGCKVSALTDGFAVGSAGLRGTVAGESAAAIEDIALACQVGVPRCPVGGVDRLQVAAVIEHPIGIP